MPATLDISTLRTLHAASCDSTEKRALMMLIKRLDKAQTVKAAPKPARKPAQEPVKADWRDRPASIWQRERIVRLERLMEIAKADRYDTSDWTAGRASDVFGVLYDSCMALGHDERTIKAQYADITRDQIKARAERKAAREARKAARKAR